MKEFCLNNEVWNETEMKNLVEHCNKLYLAWEKEFKKVSISDVVDSNYVYWRKFWGYAVSRISDVKQIFKFILKHKKINIWIPHPDFKDARLTLVHASVINAENDNIYTEEVCILRIWELLCEHFCKQVDDDSDCDDSAFIIFPYYRADKGFDYDENSLIAHYKRLQKEGKL